MRNLFQLGHFTLHSGETSKWKIECDALSNQDWAALAVMLSEILPPFGLVYGVPRGGIRLAQALRPYSAEGPMLIVDDVLTRGTSMEEAKQMLGVPCIGAVVFARGVCADWITPLFQISERL